MAVKQQRGIVPLGRECYIVLWGNVQAVLPWDGQEATDAVLPGHANAGRPAGWDQDASRPQAEHGHQSLRQGPRSSGSRRARSMAR